MIKKWGYGKTNGACKFMSSGDANKWVIDFFVNQDADCISANRGARFVYRTATYDANPAIDGDFVIYTVINGSKLDVKLDIWDVGGAHIHTYTLTDAASRLDPGTMCHCYLIYDGTNLKLRKNNAEVYDTALSLTFNDAANGNSIYFNYPLCPAEWDGHQLVNSVVMDILRLWSDNLTNDEMAGLYFHGVGSESGIFSADTSNPLYKFYGNIFNDEYGSNIIDIVDFSDGWANVYNFIQCEYGSGTYATAKETWTPKDGSSTDIYGQIDYQFSNYWMTVAQATASVLAIFTENYTPSRRITIQAPIVPGLGLLNLVYVETGPFKGINVAFFGIITAVSTDIGGLTAQYTIKELI